MALLSPRDRRGRSQSEGVGCDAGAAEVSGRWTKGERRKRTDDGETVAPLELCVQHRPSVDMGQTCSSERSEGRRRSQVWGGPGRAPHPIDGTRHAGERHYRPFLIGPRRELTCITDPSNAGATKLAVEISGDRPSLRLLDDATPLGRVGDRLEGFEMIPHQPTSIDVEVGDTSRTAADEGDISSSLSCSQRQLSCSLTTAEHRDPLTAANRCERYLAAVYDRITEHHAWRGTNETRVRRPDHMPGSEGVALAEVHQPTRRARVRVRRECHDLLCDHPFEQPGSLDQMLQEPPERLPGRSP